MKTFFLAAAIFLASSTVALAADVTADVSFLAIGKPGFLKIEGNGAHATGTIKDGAGIITCRMPELTTGIDLRDEHMRGKYLQTSLYPEATLAVEGFKTPGPGAGEVPFSGKLTLHGVTRPVTGKVAVTGSTFRATFSLTLSDFKIDIPVYMGVKVADTVDVTVSGIAK